MHCVVTSPPYFGLRDYGVAGQIGLEPTPDAYVAELVAVFREVRRVLRDDGTLWLNLGDSYNQRRARWPIAMATSTLAVSERKSKHTRAAAIVATYRKPGSRTESKRSGRHPVARRLRAASRWLVSAPGHHLVKAQPDAGERDRPLHQGARIPVSADQERAVLLRCRGDCEMTIRHNSAPT